MELRARLLDDDVDSGAQEFETVASTEDASNPAEIDDESGEEDFAFFRGGDFSSSISSNILVSEGDRNSGVDIIEQHDEFTQDMFNPDEDDIEEGDTDTLSRTVELELELWVEDDSTGDRLAETTTSTFDVSSTIARAESGDTSVEGSANTDIDEEDV